MGRDLAPVTPRHFAWQAWHNLTSTFVSRGRRGTNSHLPSFCVAAVALMVLGGASSFACKDAVLPACFFLPRASACLILACLSSFFCRPAAFHTPTSGKERLGLHNFALVTLAQRGKRQPKQTLQRIVLPPLEPQLHKSSVSSVKF